MPEILEKEQTEEIKVFGKSWVIDLLKSITTASNFAVATKVLLTF